MLILITRWLQNLICNMTKALNGQDFSKQTSNPLLHFSMLLGKPCFNYFLSSFLLLPFFISNVINFLWLHSSWDCKAYKLIKHKHSKLLRINQEQTLVSSFGSRSIVIFDICEINEYEKKNGHFFKKCKIHI